MSITKTQEMSVLLQQGGEEKVKNIIAQLVSGLPSPVAEDILELLPEMIPSGNTEFLMEFFRKEKKTGDHLCKTHKEGNGMVLKLCNELSKAKTRFDIIQIFGSVEKGCAKCQPTQWYNTDLFVAYLNNLVRD